MPCKSATVPAAVSPGHHGLVAPGSRNHFSGPPGMGRYQEPGQVRRPARDADFAACGERVPINTMFHESSLVIVAAKSPGTFWHEHRTKSRRSFIMMRFYSFVTAFLLSIGIIGAQELSGDSLVAGFEDLILEPGSYWNGSDQSGGFTSGPAWFHNYFDDGFGTWYGFSYSNMANDTTPGYINQYSAITAEGFDPGASGGGNYAVGWVLTDWVTGEPVPVTIRVVDESAGAVAGFYVTNSTYAALSMEYGDDFAKKFGGETGNDPDWFKLYVWGYNAGTPTDTVEFYLADFRFENNADDYILKTWEWVDLGLVGEVDSLKLMLGSSDTGMFGINTPTYFCLDNLTFEMESSFVDDKISDIRMVNLFPNPTSGFFRIGLDGETEAVVSVFDPAGRYVIYNERYVPDEVIDLSNEPAGNYIISVKVSGLNLNRMIIKQ